MAIKAITQLKSDVSIDLANNNIGAISPRNAREAVTDTIDSVKACIVAGTGVTVTQTDNAVTVETVSQEYTQAEKDKLAAIEAGATVDQPGAEIKTAYEGEADTNAYTDAAVAKLADIDNIGIKRHASTGLVSGGAISVNAGTTIDIAVATGEVVDAHTDPLVPTVAGHTFAGVTALAMTNIATQDFTFLGLSDSSNTVTQQATPFTLSQRRDFWWTAIVAHPDNVNIETAFAFVNSVADVNNSVYDIFDAIGVVTNGLEFSANGANLSVDKAIGYKTSNDLNYYIDRKTPNRRDVPAQVAVAFTPSYRDGSGGFVFPATTAFIDSANYDDGSGTLASVPANKYQIQRIYTFAEGTTSVTYGQAVYNSLQEAIEAIPYESAVVSGNLPDDSLRTFLIVKSGATDLSNTAQCAFIHTGRFGNLGSGGAGGITSLSNYVLKDGSTAITGTQTVSGASGQASVIVVNQASTSQGEVQFGSNVNDYNLTGGSDYLGMDINMPIGVAILHRVNVGGTTVFHVGNAGEVVSEATTQATSTTSAAIQTNGGIACVKDLIVGGDADVRGATKNKVYTVATLPTGSEGMSTYVSDGRKNGEGAAAGTGVLVFHDGTNWIACDSGQTVLA